MKSYIALPALLLLSLASGCFYEIRDDIAECKIGIYNHFAASSAYRAMRPALAGICCRHSFKEGFFAGYVAVADGGNGCVPAVPDIKCCSHMWKDFRCSDSDKMQSWFDGYEQGAAAAKADGMADSNRIITRVPLPTTVDYPTSGQGPIEAFPVEAYPTEDTPAAPLGTELPPAPITDSQQLNGRQTLRAYTQSRN